MIIRITSRYGEIDHVHKKPHTGIDLAMPEGTPLRSIDDGIIQKVVDYGDNNIGKGVIIQFEDGKQGIYGHLSEVKVKEGQIIHEGDIIGLSGNTGHSTGPHLHFGLKEDGHFIDPTPLSEHILNNIGSSWNRFIENGTVGNVDYPTIWGWLFQDWLANYIAALPILMGVSIGVWGFLNMINQRLATWGVGFVMILGAFVVI
jgi:murein DD-endopeptidase MepM/ murein hydrolase activator NlpD